MGPTRLVYWALIACNIVIPQLLWSRKIRLNVAALFSIAMAVNIGMWLERFMIIVVSLHRDFMPSAWGMYYPTRWDYFTFFGTVGLVPVVAFSVHPISAADFHFRDARTGSAIKPRGRAEGKA